MAQKNKFYVVWSGRKTGILDSWEECKEAVTGYEGAQYKGFPTLEEAKAAHAMNYWKAVKQCGSEAATAARVASIGADGVSDHKPVIPSLSVDAACSGNPGVMEYRGVWTETGKEVFRMGPFEHATNNIGEFLALVHGLALLKQHNSLMPIYSDSVNGIAWVRAKKCRTKLARTEKNIPVFDLIARAENWLENNRFYTEILKWPTESWGEIPADFGRK